MTLGQLLEEGKRCLSEAGISEAELDARYLLMDAAGISAALLLAKKGQEAERSEEERYWEHIQKRAKRIPLQHILGTQEFMGLEFCVSPQVLIPRQDTETLVEQVLADLFPEKRTASDSGRLRLLDLCTGSGCIAISLGVLGNFGEITGADISREALKVAEKNRRHLLPDCVLEKKKMAFRLIESDVFGGLSGEIFDVIVSNPPYIPSGVIEGLEPEVRDHEPRIALDGDADGLKFYRKVAEESGRFLSPGGRLYLEIGYDQGEAVSRLLEAAGFIEVNVIKDIPGLDRVVAAKLPQEGTHV